MSRKERLVPQEHLRPFDLETCVHEAATLNQRTVETYTRPFPKAPERWRAHDYCRPRPIELTAEGEVEGGLRGLLGATIDLRCTRALCAPYYSKEGGHGYDPARSCFLEGASRVDGSPDDAHCCADLRQQDKGRRSRALAGLHEAIPGEDELSDFRRRVGAAAIEAALAVFVGLFRDVGRITGALLAPEGQLEPSYSRFKGGASCSQAGRQLPWDEADRPAWGRQLQGGAKRLERRCPFPEVVQKVLRAPTVALLARAYLPADRSQTTRPQQLAAWRSLPPAHRPPRRLQWSHLTPGPQGELWGCCPKVPSDLEATVGSHLDHTDPHTQARVFGYVHHTTTHLAIERGLEWPVGTSTYPAHVHACRHFPEHRAKVALPFRSQQIELADAGYDAVEHDHGIRGRGGVPSIAYHPRREDRSPEARVARGYATHGTPSAPCGRLCRSHGYDDQSDSRQDCLRSAVSLAGTGTGAVSSRPARPGLYAQDVRPRIPARDWPHPARDRALEDPLCGTDRQRADHP